MRRRLSRNFNGVVPGAGDRADVLAEQTFNGDQFHHLDFYLMGPLNAFRHGASLGTEVYTQYGSGWILIFALLGKLFTIDYPFVMGAMPLFGAVYFLCVYALMRFLTQSAAWSFFGLLACLQLQLYSGTDNPLWCSPSSTVLRCPTDVAVAVARLLRNRYPGVASVAAGSLAGLGVLCGTDTGIYLTVALFLFSMLCLRGVPSQNGQFSQIGIWVSYFVVCTAGLLVASRGTMWQVRFWTGYFEALLEYGSGFGALPISSLMIEPVDVALFFVILMIYTLTVSRAFSGFIRGSLTDRDRVLAFIATMGFGTLMLFINRSHPYNLFHPIVPACVLVTVCFSSRFPDVGGVTTVGQWFKRRRGVSVAGIILCGILLMNPKVWDYPSVVSRVGWSLAGVPNRPQSANLNALIAKARTIADPLRKLDRLNRVAFVGEDPTVWLMTLDRAPMGRYCPAVLINQRQVNRMLDDFHRLRPQVVIVTTYPSLFGVIPEYFDKTWKTFYRDAEFAIQLSSEFHPPDE